MLWLNPKDFDGGLGSLDLGVGIDWFVDGLAIDDGVVDGLGVRDVEGLGVVGDSV